MTTHNDGSLKPLPCPFCGSEVAPVYLAGWEILCKCGINFCVQSADKQSLIAAWNTRAEQPQPAPMQVEMRHAMSEAWERVSDLNRLGMSAPISPKFEQWFTEGWKAALASRAEHAAPVLIPPEWLKPGAIVPVTAETVALLLRAINGRGDSAVPEWAKQEWPGLTDQDWAEFKKWREAKWRIANFQE